MFGLMRACSCNKDSAQKELQRLHYCGTCKTMGRLYGQKSRVLLNYDAVFLGEVLAALESPKTSFAPAFISRNCLAIPQAGQIPWTLQYAATANIVLAEFKVLDHIQDTGSKLFRLLGRLYSREFRKASRTLKSSNFPLEDLKGLISLQVERERETAPTMERLAEPTARASRLIFRHGAVRIGADRETTETMASLGAVFGEIAYLVDAIQDRDEDTKKGAFNALTAARISNEEAIDDLKSKQQEMLSHIRDLPIDEERKALFCSRLRTNLAPVLHSGSVLPMGRWNRGYRQQAHQPYRQTCADRCGCRGGGGGACCDGCCDCCNAGCCACQCAETGCCIADCLGC